jgi:hypothetical protein
MTRKSNYNKMGKNIIGRDRSDKICLYSNEMEEGEK